MSQNRSTRKNPAKEPEYEEESVPKNLRDFNKPGKKDLSASGSASAPPDAGTSETRVRPSSAGYFGYSSVAETLSGAASILWSTEAAQKKTTAVSAEDVTETDPFDDEDDAEEVKKEEPQAGAQPWNTPVLPPLRRRLAGTTPTEEELAALAVRRPSGAPAPDPRLTPETTSPVQFATPGGSPLDSPRGTPTGTPEGSPVVLPPDQEFGPDPPGTPEFKMYQEEVDAMNAKMATMINDLKIAQDAHKQLLTSLAVAPNKKEVATQEAKVPTFAGIKDDRSAEAWWSKAESIAKQNDWEDERFIETATSVMIKEAEDWVVYIRDQQNMYCDDTILKNKETFKAAFLQQFSRTKSIAGQTQTLLNMKQAKEETVNAYWVRVQNYFNKIVKDHTERKKMKPDKVLLNADYQKMTFLAEFMRDEMINKYFVGGLLPHLEREIAPRVREIQERDPIEGVLRAAVEAERAAPAQKKDPPFQASSIAALNVSGVTEEDLGRMELSVRQAIVAAFEDSSSSGRGRRD